MAAFWGSFMLISIIVPCVVLRLNENMWRIRCGPDPGNRTVTVWGGRCVVHLHWTHVTQRKDINTKIQSKTCICWLKESWACCNVHVPKACCDTEAIKPVAQVSEMEWNQMCSLSQTLWTTAEPTFHQENTWWSKTLLVLFEYTVNLYLLSAYCQRIAEAAERVFT